MPGLEVRSDGRLYYNNRLIRKLYLDGQELFSQNYTLLTKNLAANLIDKVQAIEHHTENPLLRGIERSDETVLNLQVKAERKTRLMGNVAVESGTLKRGSLNGSLFSLKGRTKVGIIGSANTIGQEVASPFPNALTGDAAFMSLAPVVKSQRLANVGLGIITPNEVERRRFLFNQAALLGTDVNVQLFRNLKLKVEGNGWRDRQQAEAITTTELTLPERKIRLQDSIRQTEKPRQWNGRLRLDYTPGTRQSFRWIAEMNSQEQTQRNQLYTANLALTERVRLGSTLRSQSQHHELEWVHKLRSQDAFVVTTNLTSVTQPLTADFTSQRYALFYGLNPADYPGLHYDIHQRRNQWQASMFWKASRSKDSTSQSKTYWKVGIESHWQSDGFRSGYSGPELPDSSWAIAGAYRQWVVVPLAEVKQQNRRWGYTFQVTLPWYQLEHTEAVRRANLRSTRMQPNGMLGLSYQTPSLRQLFSLNLTHRVQVPGVESIWDSFQPSSYRSFYRGLAAFRPVKTTSGLLLFRHNQLASYQTLMGNISYQLRSKGVIPRYTVTDLFSFSSLVPFEGSIQDWHIGGS
ncbi:hypothetical protein BWI93_25100 [Siphonobacter sp. BAB-5385]|nr:hypothetical protein BWI93_25100 [Siphonobacter sp. BAB-5385]